MIRRLTIATSFAAAHATRRKISIATTESMIGTEAGEETERPLFLLRLRVAVRQT